MTRHKHRIELFDRIAPDSIGAELGVFEGEFTEEIASAIRPNKIFAVDLFSGHITSGNQNGEDRHGCDMDARYEELKRRWQNSPLVPVQSESSSWLWSQPRGSLDWVYIDTSHDYQHTAHELAAAHHAVKAGGWIMGHDWDMEFSGVISATAEYAERWGCDLELTTEDGLASFALERPSNPLSKPHTGMVLQIAHGKRDERLWDINGAAIKSWAEHHGWRYQLQRENVAAPLSAHWTKLASELDLLTSAPDVPLLTLDADVLLRSAHVSPAEVFECHGIGMAIGGQASYCPHFNCGVRAVWGRRAKLLLELAWKRRKEFMDHPWNEQASIHSSMGHFPGTVFPISPRWNHNYNDRHMQGKVDTVIFGYHGTSNREELMLFEQQSWRQFHQSREAA